MSKSFNLKIQACLLFAVLIGIGGWLSGMKPLWNDEIFSQTGSVQGISYAQIMLGRAPEGNTCPLFYLIQKCVTDLAGYRLKAVPGVQDVKDVNAQKILRFTPNVCMSLTVVMIFYFFTSIYGRGWGLYVLLLTLSSYMVLTYWVEARHYALWVCLSTMQLLIFMKLLSQKGHKGAWLWLLATVHMLMSLTVIFSLIQIAIVSFVYWLSGQRDWRKHIPLSAVPMMIALYYYSQAPHYRFWSVHPFWELLNINMPVDFLCIAGLYAVCMLYRWFRTRQQPGDAMYFFLLAVLMWLAAIALIGVMLFGQQERDGFELTFRYYIFLNPISIVAAVLMARELVNVAKEDTWALAAIGTAFLGLLAIRVINAYIWALGWYPF